MTISNLMDIGSIIDVTSEDVLLSILPIHHVFECTVGFLFSLYKGAQTVFCDGLRHVVENLKEYRVTVMACVPAIYERIFMNIRKQLERKIHHLHLLFLLQHLVPFFLLNLFYGIYLFLLLQLEKFLLNHILVISRRNGKFGKQDRRRRRIICIW